MKLTITFLLLIISCTAHAQSSSMDSIAARFKHGFIEINYDENGKPDIDTALLRKYSDSLQRISDKNRLDCPCHPLNIAKRMREERERKQQEQERWMQLTPQQQDSISEYIMNAPLFEPDTSYKPFGLLDSTRRNKPDTSGIMNLMHYDFKPMYDIQQPLP